MTDITIPPEALEEAAEELFHMQYGDSKGSWADAPEWLKITIRAEARAALLAGLKAWPGMKLNPSWELRTHKRSVEMILPVSEPPKMDRKAAVAERLFGDD